MRGEEPKSANSCIFSLRGTSKNSAIKNMYGRSHCGIFATKQRMWRRNSLDCKEAARAGAHLLRNALGVCLRT